MPELDLDAVRRFWYEYKDPMIYRVITFMEGVEDWTLDGDSALETAMNRLGNQLDEIGNQDLGSEEKFIRLCCNIKSSRALRLLQCIDTANPGAASKLLIHAEEVTKSDDDDAGVFLRRNIVFERLRLLSRVMSKERLALVLKALEGEDG